MRLGLVISGTCGSLCPVYFTAFGLSIRYWAMRDASSNDRRARVYTSHSLRQVPSTGTGIGVQYLWDCSHCRHSRRQRKPWDLYRFPMAVVTINHKLSGLKEHIYFLAVLEARNPKSVSLGNSQSRGQQGCCPLWRL